MFQTFMFCFSMASMIFTGIYIHNTIYTPFVLPMAENYRIIAQTLGHFYHFTTTHAPCYFIGASTMILIRDYKHVSFAQFPDFSMKGILSLAAGESSMYMIPSQVKLSSTSKILLWIGSVICAIYAVFGTYPWNRGDYPGEAFKVSMMV